MSWATLLAVSAAACLWVLKGVLGGIVYRLGERLADYLLPLDRRSTYRLPRWIAQSARATAPKRLFRWRGPATAFTIFFAGPANPYVYTGTQLDWDHSEAALAELDADEDGSQITQPVRLVLPLLRQALVYRTSNWANRLLELVWTVAISVPVQILLVLIVALGGAIEILLTGSWRPLDGRKPRGQQQSDR